MASSFEDGPPVALGYSVLAFVQVIPILTDNSDADRGTAQVALSSPFVKIKLQRLSRRRKLGIKWDSTTEDGEGSTESKDQKTQIRESVTANRLKRGFLYSTQRQSMQGQLDDRPTLSFPSEDPLVLQPIPCLVIAHAVMEGMKFQGRNAVAVILDGTLVRVLPAIPASSIGRNPSSSSLLEKLVGEAAYSPLSKELCLEMEHNNDPQTIQELQLRMLLLLAEPIHIGTTADALSQLEQQSKRQHALASAIRTYSQQKRHGPGTNIDGGYNVHRTTTKKQSATDQQEQLPSILRDGALLVHSPDHAAGKTTLVRYIAQECLKCNVVHVIQPAALLAKYGSQADAGLESTMHAIVTTAAVAKQATICIILDHFQAMMPPALSLTSGAGDAAVPVLHAMAAQLKSLILSIQRSRQFPFPTKNSLYNVAGKGGFVFSVRLCLVAIVTCPDNGWRSAGVTGTSSTGILNALPMGTYRLPALNAATRIRAFERALERERIELADNDARQQVQTLAVAALWAKGRQFTLVAKRLQRLIALEGTCAAATAEQVQQAFDFYASGKPGGTQLVARQRASSSKLDPFSSVGGTGEAKKALLDALTLDASKRALLDSMGLDSPIGVLLYGPPGCGKTLLAKAVASYLGADNQLLGGAFIPLNSSDIVQSAVGESEKLIVNAFVAARDNAPSVIFIDEFQALFMERSSSGSSKLSSTLLQCMDDVKQWRKANKSVSTAPTGSSKTVVVLGATNTPWMLDKSFLRPGRFDRIIHVGLPSERDREAILGVHIGRMRIKGGKDAVPTISKHVANKTEGYSGADLAALCNSAAIRALIEKCDCIEEQHFLEEVEKKTGGSSNSQLVLRNQSWRP
ncbi:metalloprotease FTSH [Seminavis robusta]|uniref:Metalloprotease FTSH n=1 Tax=Seminavis robusta TaxID=568900 RepID=A0A9N8DXN9_9STRA|nr:metalloprotease FTSH [Seminavis robusta]|eukprot:Sro358_g125920.1 metalloprotease FTSH (858) ;mRNA; f:46236-48988